MSLKQFHNGTADITESYEQLKVMIYKVMIYIGGKIWKKKSFASA